MSFSEEVNDAGRAQSAGAVDVLGKLLASTKMEGRDRLN